MGHDIVIKLGKCTVSRTYITGNFYDLSFEHGGIHRMHGHTSETVCKIAQEAIDALSKLGFEEPVPEGGSWGWGHSGDKETPYSEEKRRGIYVYHMRRFQKLAKQHPGCRWYSDQVWDIEKYKDESDGEEEPEEEEEEEYVPIAERCGVLGESTRNGFCGLIRIRGEMRHVDSYLAAMRTYVDVLEETGSHEQAQKWLALAKTFDDSPI